MSGPRQPSVQSCADNTETTTTTTTPSQLNSVVAVAGGLGLLNGIKLIIEEGICHDINIYPHPSSLWLGPNTFSWIDDSIVGCGGGRCYSGEDCTATYDDCYTFNLKDGWNKISNPEEVSFDKINATYPRPLYGSLVNVENVLYYLSSDPSMELQMYSRSEDNWLSIANTPFGFVNPNCVLDIGHQILAQFKSSDGGIYTFDLVSKQWTRLPWDKYRAYSSCVFMGLPDGNTGVMVIGGQLYDSVTVNTVEILNLATGTWTEMEPFDERWILNYSGGYGGTFSSYGFLHLGGKPTIIGRFNDTNINVMEQFDVEKGSWTLQDFDMTDPPCGSSYPCLTNAANIPSHIFPPC